MALHERGFSGSGILVAKSRSVGCSRFWPLMSWVTRELMQAEEDVTHSRMRQLRSEVIDPNIARYGGRIVKNTGDGFLATFENAHDATHCAIEIQQEMIDRNSGEPVARQINFRMGINVADIIVEPEDVYGDGVNIAARLQTYAEPGGIVISDLVSEQVGRQEGIQLADLGDLPLHNMARPIRAYSLLVGRQTSRPLGEALPGNEGRPSIVVLPFREQQGKPGEEYFAEGIVDDIVHALSGLKELFVIARGSTLGYRASTVDVRTIGRELDVRYVMMGSVQRASGKLRIRTELCNSDTGAIVYADQYDGDLGDLFELQRQITTKLVTTLAPQVREHERLRAMRKHPQNMTAYDYVLQALRPLFQMDYASFSLAHGLLQKAIAHDPHYGPAYSYASYWHLLRVGQGWSKDAAVDTASAARNAASAIELDENDALALAIQGHVFSYLKKDYNSAMELQDRAIEAGPSCAMAWTLSSVTRGFVGQGPIAVLRAERGLQLSPRGPHVVYHEHILSQAHYTNGNYDEAVAWGRRAAKSNERLTSNLRCLIASLVATGQMEEARQVAGRLLQFQPDFHLASFARMTPLQGTMRDDFVERLRIAGLPD